MAFYNYSQNNSGGYFDGDYHHIIVEAPDAERANLLAEAEGIYFNGCSTGRDCDCCGDRWSEAYGYEGDAEPMIYGKPVAEYEDGWGLNQLVVYMDGRREEFTKKAKRLI